MPVSGTRLPLERVFSDHAGFGGIPVTCGSIGRPVGNNAPGLDLPRSGEQGYRRTCSGNRCRE